MSRSKSANPNYMKSTSMSGYFPRSFHLEMVQDRNRVKIIQLAIERLGYRFGGGVFCDLGTGTGIFSIEAARFFDHVYAFEADEDVLFFARKEVERLGLNKQITLIHGNVEDSSIISSIPPVTVLFAEMLSIWMIEEPQLKAISNFRPTLIKGGFVSPSKIVNLLSVGKQDYAIGNFELKAPAGQFAMPSRPVIVTETKVAKVFDMSMDYSPHQKGSISFIAIFTEELNCVVLSSFVEFIPGANFSSSDSLMPTTIFPTLNVIEVTAGDIFWVDYEYIVGSKLEQAHFRLRRTEK